jgi:hypothetical protein
MHRFKALQVVSNHFLFRLALGMYDEVHSIRVELMHSWCSVEVIAAVPSFMGLNPAGVEGIDTFW